MCLSPTRGFRETYGVKSPIGGTSNNCNWGDLQGSCAQQGPQSQMSTLTRQIQEWSRLESSRPQYEDKCPLLKVGDEQAERVVEMMVKEAAVPHTKSPFSGVNNFLVLVLVFQYSVDRRLRQSLWVSGLRSPMQNGQRRITGRRNPTGWSAQP